MQGEEGGGVGAPGEADAEQPLTPVDRHVESVGQHVPGGENALDVLTRAVSCPTLGAHHVARRART